MSRLVLHQIIAAEKGAKSRLESVITEIYKGIQKPEEFKGFIKKYTPKDDEGERFQDEKKVIQRNYVDTIKKAKKAFADLFDTTATRDYANCNARADVILDGFTIVQAPVTYLLFLEKKLVDIHTMVKALPTLDPDHEWTPDAQDNFFRSETVQTVKTKKINTVVTLAPATTEHAAQAQLAQEDVSIGHWDTTNLSGAIPMKQKEEILERIERVIKEVKFAREKANTTEVDEQRFGDAILAQIFK